MEDEVLPFLENNQKLYNSFEKPRPKSPHPELSPLERLFNSAELSLNPPEKSHSTHDEIPSSQLAPKPSKRQEIVDEIFSTEETYVQCLSVLVNFYLKKKPPISENERHVIFSNIELLLPVNQELYSQLMIRKNNWNDESLIGDIFVKMGPMLKMYRVYAENYNSALQMLRQCNENNEKWQKFVKKTREFLKNSENHRNIEANLSLDSLLIMPIQRIPRYKLLLSELLKNTPENHIDFMNIKKGLEIMKDVAESLNKFIQESEDRQKVVLINNLLSGRPSSLVEPHRIFIYEGDVSKITRRFVRACHFWLFNDIIVYSHRKIVTHWQYNGEIPLKTSWVRSLEDSEKVKNAFQIVGEKKTWTFYARNHQEKEKWMTEIGNVIEKLVQQHPEFLKRRSKVKTQSSIWSAWTSFRPQDYDLGNQTSLNPPNIKSPNKENISTSNQPPFKENISTLNQPSFKELASIISHEATQKKNVLHEVSSDQRPPDLKPIHQKEFSSKPIETKSIESIESKSIESKPIETKSIELIPSKPLDLISSKSFEPNPSKPMGFKVPEENFTNLTFEMNTKSHEQNMIHQNKHMMYLDVPTKNEEDTPLLSQSETTHYTSQSTSRTQYPNLQMPKKHYSLWDYLFGCCYGSQE